MSDQNLGENLTQIFSSKNRYIIPLYQRNYAWGKEQIDTLIQDIYEAYETNNGNYYIGSLVVLQRRNGDYEVIDGQQRLTTLSLLTKILGITKTPVLFYESRPEVESFFDEFYKSIDNSCFYNPQTHYLHEAVEYIKSATVIGKNENVEFNVWSEKIKDYLSNRVILVKVTIPEDTDVASYFEIMNNRGEQLQKHEVLKARLMNVLDTKYHHEFDLIWTACSNMDRPIQQCFNADDRRTYFGEGYDDFLFKTLNPLRDANNNPQQDENEGASINKILESDSSSLEVGDVEVENNANDIHSIIDFPNFLMHIMKLYANNNGIDEDVRLNEKYMLSCADLLFKDLDKEKVLSFISLLFKSRTLFDRYIIKTKGLDSEDEFSWELNRPQTYKNNGKLSVKYDLNTFECDDIQKQIIKAQSMLQVTYRQRIYKNWLQDTLSYLVFDNDCKDKAIEGEKLLYKVNTIIYDQYKALKINLCDDDNRMYCEGVNTPHLLLNFIDYLYWIDDKKNKILDGFNLAEFNFRYWNSVEHHLAVNIAKQKGIADDIVNSLGNLFMISKNANSRLSDRDVRQKVEMSKDLNMGSNRQIIYKTTRDNNYEWGVGQIIEHYEDIRNLLNNAEKLLGQNQGEQKSE